MIDSSAARRVQRGLAVWLSAEFEPCGVQIWDVGTVTVTSFVRVQVPHYAEGEGVTLDLQHEACAWKSSV